MQIAFWSNRSESAVTANLAAVSTTLSNIYGLKITLFENHKGKVDLAACFLKSHQKSILRESRTYYLGFSEFDCFVERLSEGYKRVWRGMNKVTIIDGLLYYMCQAEAFNEMFELQFNDLVPEELKKAKKSSIVCIDTKASSNISSKTILKESDIVVINLRHESFFIHDFFEKYSEIADKAFFIISDCSKDDYLSAFSIIKKYGIEDSLITYIPHSDTFAEVIKDGCCIEFLMNGFEKNIYAKDYNFIRKVKETAGLLYNFIKMKEGDKDKVLV